MLALSVSTEDDHRILLIDSFAQLLACLSTKQSPRLLDFNGTSTRLVAGYESMLNIYTIRKELQYAFAKSKLAVALGCPLPRSSQCDDRWVVVFVNLVEKTCTKKFFSDVCFLLSDNNKFLVACKSQNEKHLVDLLVLDTRGIVLQTLTLGFKP